MSNTPGQPPPQTKTGCVLMILFLFGTAFGGYLIVRVIYWLLGMEMPKG